MEPYATTIFCEDIRYEVNSKLSLVGVFTDDIVLPQVPVIVPKLGIVSKINLPWDFSAETMAWRVYFPGDATDAPGFQLVTDIREILAGNRANPPIIDPELDVVPSHNFLQQIVFSPVQIKSSGYIRVRISIGDRLLKAGALRAVTSPPAAPT